jgi:hypothetical protein
VRFEDFVLRQDQTLARLEKFLGIDLGRIVVRPEAVERWKRAGDGRAFDFLEPAMREYGYELPGPAIPAAAALASAAGKQG